MDAATQAPVEGRDLSARRVVGAVAQLALLAVVTVVGAGIGWTLAPTTTTYVGPLEVDVDVVPSLNPGVHVRLPPVGQVRFDTHSAPVAVEASVRGVDLDQARQLIGSPQGLLALQLSAPQVVRDAATRAVAVNAGCAVLGALAVGVLVYRTGRRAVEATLLSTAGLVVVAAVAAATFDAAALRQPKFVGLLSRAPYVAGEGVATVDRLESYRTGLADFVQSVTTLYAVADQLPVGPRGATETTTVLHISDIHLNPLGFDLAAQLVEQFGVDVVADTGDLTTWGTSVESATLSRIGELGVPYVFVRGNHDSRATQAAVAAQPNAVVLDGQVAEVAGVTFAGIGDPVFTPQGETGEGEGDTDLIAAATGRLAEVIEEHEQRPADAEVDVALIHDPSHLDPLFGEVPLVLAGHYHRRVIRVDESGTMVMVQGSTGGAGLTIRGLQRLGVGEPLPLTATLLHFADDGERAGQLVAYDLVTVGGLGLQSVTVERTIVPAPGTESAPADVAREDEGVPAPGGPPVSRTP